MAGLPPQHPAPASAGDRRRSCQVGPLRGRRNSQNHAFPWLPLLFARSGLPVRASVTACVLILQLDLLAPEEDADLVAHRTDDANCIRRAGLEPAGIPGVDVERPVFPRLLELVGRGRHPGDVVLLLRDRNRYERLSFPLIPLQSPASTNSAVDDLEC